MITQSNSWRQSWTSSFTTRANTIWTKPFQQPQIHKKKAKRLDKDPSLMKYLILELGRKEITEPWIISCSYSMNQRISRIHSKSMVEISRIKTLSTQTRIKSIWQSDSRELSKMEGIRQYRVSKSEMGFQIWMKASSILEINLQSSRSRKGRRSRAHWHHQVQS